MQINRYSKKEPQVFMWFIAPYIISINLLLFGSCIVSSLKNFCVSFGISLLYFTFIYAVFGAVAVLIKKRFPGDADLFKRIAFMLPLFYIMNILSVQCIYLVYETLAWSGCTVLRQMEWWVTGFGCLASTILTFINEAVAGWEKWKASVTETSRLQNAYHRGRLLSLKRQINPHFLFNCFNTLSSLIQEDENEAEHFLDELTKVYRYLLKGDEEQLVSLEEELRFIEAYLYLNITRFGNALQVNISVEENNKEKKIAPLSLQIVLESIIYCNAFSKSSPLEIKIYTSEAGVLIVKHTVQPKASVNIKDYEETLDDLVNKYKLLCKPQVRIVETAIAREIRIPLIDKAEVAA